MARLLVFTPTYGDGPNQRTLDSVAEQKFDGELVHEVSWHNPYSGGRDMRNVTAQYQRARQMVLDSDYDGLLCVEHDMDIPQDAAQKMWDTPAHVVYAPYLLRHGPTVLSLWHWTGGKNLGMSLSLYPKELEHMRKQGVGPVCGVGFGCTLIKRAVVAKIPFRGPEDAAPDLPFALDCIRKNFPPLGRFDIECGHYHGGRWLWPWKQEGNTVIGRLYMLQTVNANVNGASQKLVRGKYYSLPQGVREDLVRAGYATHLDNEPDWETGARELAIIEQEREVAVAPVAVGRILKRRPRWR